MARTLPSAPEAEVTLLGNMMVYPSAARIAMEEGLCEDDFFIEANNLVVRCYSINLTVVFNFIVTIVSIDF